VGAGAIEVDVVDVVRDVGTKVVETVVMVVPGSVEVTVVPESVEVTVVVGRETIIPMYPPTASITITTTTTAIRDVREIALLVEKPMRIFFRKTIPASYFKLHRIRGTQSILVSNLLGCLKST
jgi:hypothetical protein